VGGKLPRQPVAKPVVRITALAPIGTAVPRSAASIDASRRQLRFSRPRLPEEVEELSIRDLRIGDASIDLDLHRYPRNVGVDVVGRRGDLEVSVIK